VGSALRSRNGAPCEHRSGRTALRFDGRRGQGRCQKRTTWRITRRSSGPRANRRSSSRAPYRAGPLILVVIRQRPLSPQNSAKPVGRWRRERSLRRCAVQPPPIFAVIVSVNERSFLRPLLRLNRAFSLGKSPRSRSLQEAEHRAYNKSLKRTPRETPELICGSVPRGAAYLGRYTPETLSAVPVAPIRKAGRSGQGSLRR